MDTVSSESMQALNDNFKDIDKAGGIETLEINVEEINRRVNNYLMSCDGCGKRTAMVHASSIISSGVRNLDPESIWKLDCTSSSFSLFNRIHREPSVELLSEFMTSLHNDIEYLYNRVEQRNRVVK